jgi:hypothetical protein
MLRLFLNRVSTSVGLDNVLKRSIFDCKHLFSFNNLFHSFFDFYKLPATLRSDLSIEETLVFLLLPRKNIFSHRST